MLITGWLRRNGWGMMVEERVVEERVAGEGMVGELGDG